MLSEYEQIVYSNKTNDSAILVQSIMDTIKSNFKIDSQVDHEHGIHIFFPNNFKITLNSIHNRLHQYREDALRIWADCIFEQDQR